ncbi:hypothetical protein CAOG_05050 [Capsaspora owczarzaki ATCC 30864]|uniref:PX domain-containing protein n=1 Tax=Capsaspora owczarzaki (strain ATCC 30864) TaxID=595528 RepID=A0A0D2VT57_CAPO3|nr:hypothetical protein CAOG_05050 [Capsaspora owczarzaki ATCC 30864]KJE94407.1 hypothetical protein CAOG_005050 [Capsaspora owczarzaki ATCC 30864]|eukprot:XP_004346735.2 hypothetical protein CAOG_05050 [Capsaspora owczarzaki ATCC 30864]
MDDDEVDQSQSQRQSQSQSDVDHTADHHDHPQNDKEDAAHCHDTDTTPVAALDSQQEAEAEAQEAAAHKRSQAEPAQAYKHTAATTDDNPETNTATNATVVAAGTRRRLVGATSLVVLAIATAAAFSSVLLHPSTLIVVAVAGAYALVRVAQDGRLPSLLSWVTIARPSSRSQAPLLPATTANAAAAVCAVCQSDKCNHADRLVKRNGGVTAQSSASLAGAPGGLPAMAYAQSGSSGLTSFTGAVQVPETLDRAVRLYLDKLLADYVDYWFTPISADTLFLDELRSTLRFVVLGMVDRGCKVDWEAVACTDMLQVAAELLHAYMCALEDLKQQKRANPTRSHFISDQEMASATLKRLPNGGHICMQSPELELEYWRKISDRLASLLMPAPLPDCQSAQHLLREMFAAKVLVPSLPAIYDTDFVNRMLYKALCEYVPFDGPVMDGPITRLRRPDYHTVPPTQAVLLAGYGGGSPLASVLHVALPDILSQPPLLFVFMKFLGTQQALHILQFCLSVENYNEQAVQATRADPEQQEALATQAKDLFKMYIKPVGISALPVEDAERVRIERLIFGQEESGRRFPDATCFMTTYSTCYKLLAEVYCPLFQRSEMYFKFLCHDSKALSGQTPTQSQAVRPVTRQAVAPTSRAPLRGAAPPMSAATGQHSNTNAATKPSKMATFKAKNGVGLQTSAVPIPVTKSGSNNNNNNNGSLPRTPTVLSSSPYALSSGIPSAIAGSSRRLEHARTSSTSSSASDPVAPLSEAGNVESTDSLAVSQSPPLRDATEGATTDDLSPSASVGPSALASTAHSQDVSLAASPVESRAHSRSHSRSTSAVSLAGVESAVQQQQMPPRQTSNPSNSPSRPLTPVAATLGSTPPTLPHPTSDLAPVRQGIDMKRWRIAIRNVSTQRENLKKYVLYRIAVTAPMNTLQQVVDPSSIAEYASMPGRDEETWIVSRRYSDFDALDTCLRNSSYGDQGQLELPGKKTFGNMDANFVDTRRASLEKYLQALIADVNLHESVLLHAFFTPTPTFRQLIHDLNDHDVSRVLKAVPQKIKEISVGIVSAPMQWFSEAGNRARELEGAVQSFVPSLPAALFDWQQHRFQRKRAAARLNEDVTSASNDRTQNLTISGPMETALFVLENAADVPRSRWNAAASPPAERAPASTPGLPLLLALGKFAAGATFDDFIERKLRDNIEFQLRENSALDLLQLLYAATFDAAPVVTDEERARNKQIAYDEMFKFLPPIAHHIVGVEYLRNCAENFFELLQNPQLSKQLVLSVLDITIVKFFPELSASATPIP